MTLLKIFSMLLVRTSLSSMPIICRFSLFRVSHRFQMFCSYLLVNLYFLTVWMMKFLYLVFKHWYSVLPMIHFIGEPFHRVFIWLTEFFISNIPLGFLQPFCLYWLLFSYLILMLFYSVFVFSWNSFRNLWPLWSIWTYLQVSFWIFCLWFCLVRYYWYY